MLAMGSTTPCRWAGGVPQESIAEAWLAARYRHRDVSDFGISMSENARSGNSISAHSNRSTLLRRRYDARFTKVRGKISPRTYERGRRARDAGATPVRDSL